MCRPSPPRSTTSSRRNASAEASESGVLPNTGGPEGVLLIGRRGPARRRWRRGRRRSSSPDSLSEFPRGLSLNGTSLLVEQGRPVHVCVPDARWSWWPRALGLLVLVFAFQATRTALASGRHAAEVTQLRAEILRGDVADARRTSHVARRHAAHGARLLRRDASGTRRRSCRSSGTTSRPSRSSRARSTAPLPGTPSLSAWTWWRPFVVDICRPTTGVSTGADPVELAPKVALAAKATAAAERDLRPIDPDGCRPRSARPRARCRTESPARRRRVVSELGHPAAARHAWALPAAHLPARGPEQRGGQVDRRTARLAVAGARTTARRMGFGDLPVELSALGPPVLRCRPISAASTAPRWGEGCAGHHLTPDFRRTGELLERDRLPQAGEKLDGVVSVDPIALSRVLRALGRSGWARRP